VSTALIRTEADIESTISALAARPGGGLVVIPDTFANEHRELVLGLTARYRIPAIYSNSDASTTSRALIIYNHASLDTLRRAATYIDKIIKGEKAGELPVQQPTNFGSLSTSRPPRCSASPSRQRSLSPPMKSSNSVFAVVHTVAIGPTRKRPSVPRTSVHWGHSGLR
jgi:hypothetical protein